MESEPHSHEGKACCTGKSSCCGGKALAAIALLLAGGAAGFFLGKCKRSGMCPSHMSAPSHPPGH